MAKRVISGPPLFPESWVELDNEVAAVEKAAAEKAAAAAAAASESDATTMEVEVDAAGQAVGF